MRDLGIGMFNIQPDPHDSQGGLAPSKGEATQGGVDAGWNVTQNKKIDLAR